MKKTKADFILLIAFVVFTLLVRLGTLMPIDTGVDVRDYWESAQALANGSKYPELTHRTVRFSVILPIAASLKIFGDTPNSYYILPVLNSVIQTLLFYAIGCSVRGPLTGFISAIFITIFPYMIRNGSQLLPESFSLTYITIAFFLFISYLKNPAYSYRKLSIIGLIIFISYEAKITNVFFLPGFALSLFLAKRSIRQALFVCIVPFFLLIVETLIYRYVSSYPFGQLQVIAANHLSNNAALKELDLFDLFSRYASPNLQLYWQIPFLLFAISSVWYLTKMKDALILQSLIIPGIFFFLGITFAVKSINPIIPAEPFINRYFTVVLSVVIPVVVSAFIDVSCHFSISKYFHIDLSVGKYITALTLFLVFGGLISSFAPLPSTLRRYLPSPFDWDKHPLALNENYYRIVNEGWNNGMPLISKIEQKNRTAGLNALQASITFFLKRENYIDGVRPKPRIVEIHNSSFAWVSSKSVLDLKPDSFIVLSSRNPLVIEQVTLREIAYARD